MGREKSKRKPRDIKTIAGCLAYAIVMLTVAWLVVYGLVTSDKIRLAQAIEKRF